jgi:NADPH:quinone reductase-like Zn-dependent oxidoreductase
MPVAPRIESRSWDRYLMLYAGNARGAAQADSATRRLTKGQGAQVVFDAVGGPLFELALRSLAHRGRQLEITSAVDRRVSFDLLDFYHNENRLFGVDTRKRDATASAAILEALTPLFEDGAFHAPVIHRVIPLSEGSSAYAQVARGEARGRLVLAARISVEAIYLIGSSDAGGAFP